MVADGANNPAWIAADLLSQAEHDPAAQSILITDDEAFAAKVEAAKHAPASALCLERSRFQAMHQQVCHLIAVVQEAANVQKVRHPPSPHPLPSRCSAATLGGGNQ